MYKFSRKFFAKKVHIIEIQYFLQKIRHTLSAEFSIQLIQFFGFMLAGWLFASLNFFLIVIIVIMRKDLIIVVACPCIGGWGCVVLNIGRWGLVPLKMPEKTQKRGQFPPEIPRGAKRGPNFRWNALLRGSQTSFPRVGGGRQECLNDGCQWLRVIHQFYSAVCTVYHSAF